MLHLGFVIGIEIEDKSWNEPDALEIHLLAAVASALLFYVSLCFLDQVIDFFLSVFEAVSHFFNRGCSRSNKHTARKGDIENVQLETLPTNDQRVKTEEALVQQLIKENKMNSKQLIVKQLSKWFGNFQAVKDVSFTVNYNECFGLLGIFFIYNKLVTN